MGPDENCPRGEEVPPGAGTTRRPEATLGPPAEGGLHVEVPQGLQKHNFCNPFPEARCRRPLFCPALPVSRRCPVRETF